MALNRTTIALLSTGVLFAGCENETPEKQVAEARQEFKEEVREAKTIQDSNRRAEEMNEAKQDFEEARDEAREDMQEDAKDGGEMNADGDRGRFAALEDETDAAFVDRAKKRMEAVEAELNALDASRRETSEIQDVEKKLEEARKDLGEFQGDKLVDDGKLGVTAAINAAERQLDDLGDES